MTPDPGKLVAHRDRAWREVDKSALTRAGIMDAALIIRGYRARPLGVEVMAVVVLFRGPEHVMEWSDDEGLRLSPRDGRGVPVREAFPEETYRPIQAAMDEAYRTGRRVRVKRPHGIFIADPRRDDDGDVFGVATVWVSEVELLLLPPREPPRPRAHRSDQRRPGTALADRQE